MVEFMRWLRDRRKASVGGNTHGDDILQEVSINLEDVLKSKNVQMNVDKDVTCPGCKGSGCTTGTVKVQCPDCKGVGRRRGVKHISFGLPKGVDTGDYRIPGEGNEVPGGVDGDLIVRVRVRPHPELRRNGSDLYYDKHMSRADAEQCSRLTIPTLEGTETVKLNTKTRSSTVIKLKGRGLPRMNSWGKGDLYAVIEVV